MSEGKNIKLDEIGRWSEIKLDIIQKYANAYSKILSKQRLKHFYIDGFAGYGIHKSKTREELIQGSPIIALNVTPPFSGYYFIDLNGDKVENLRELAKKYPNVSVFGGDCNEVLLEKVFPNVKYEDYKRALCLLDPYGLHLNWEVLLAAGKSRAIEIFLNFPIMDMNRNVLWKNPEKVDLAQIERMNTFWGDESWRNVAYVKTAGLFDTIEEKTSNETIAQAFKRRCPNRSWRFEWPLHFS